jgi:hypothetical protein
MGPCLWGVRLEALMLREGHPLGDDGRQMSRKAVRARRVFVGGLRCLRAEAGPRGRETFRCGTRRSCSHRCSTLHIFVGFDETTVRVLRAAVVDRDSGGHGGNFWSGFGLGERWFEPDGTCRGEMSLRDMVAPRVLKGIVRCGSTRLLDPCSRAPLDICQ